MSRSRIYKWAENTYFDHKKRGLNFEEDVTIPKLRELMRDNLNKQCVYCSRILSFDNEDKYRPTLDVINPKHLLSMDNLQIIDKQCNTMKQRMNHSQFLRFRQTPKYLRQVKCPEGSFPGRISGRIR